MKFYITMSMIIIANSTLGQVVFSHFPVHSEDYAVDIRMIMEKTIEKHGLEEWRMVVLTSELHGHVGVYAIIGAKMGLYAREVLNAGQDELSIISYAGSKPPVSCLNDGLQASTGATLGHGLISIREDIIASPAAEFTHAGKTLRISLIESLNIEIEESIKAAIKTNGGLTEEYWQKVRELALICWLEYDRKEIFEIQEIIK